VSRRKSLALSAVGLVAVASLLAGCTSATLTDPRQILTKVNTSLTKLNSVHFHLEAGGQFAVGVEAAATPAPTDTPAPSASPSVSASAVASSSAVASGSAGASSSAGASARASAGASAAASGSASPSPSPSPTPTPVPTVSPSPSTSPTPVPTPVYTALPVSLTGTLADGDIDYANNAAHITGGLPGLPGLSGEMIVTQDFAYIRGYGATRYTEETASSLSIDPALSSQSLYFIQQIVAAASDASLSPVLVGMESEPGGQCYHIRVAVTQAALSAKLSNVPNLQDKGNGQMDLWITQNDFQLERLEFTTSDPAAGAAAIRLVLSHWNSVGEIDAPPQNQVVNTPQ
jgi:hypothetical protein